MHCKYQLQFHSRAMRVCLPRVQLACVNAYFIGIDWISNTQLWIFCTAFPNLLFQDFWIHNYHLFISICIKIPFQYPLDENMTDILCSPLFPGDVAFGWVKTQVWSSSLTVAGSLKGQSGMHYNLYSEFLCIILTCSLH